MINSKLLNLNTTLFRSYLLNNKPRLFCRCFIYCTNSSQNRPVNNVKKRDLLSLSEQQQLLGFNRIRWAMRGGPGYTKFAHGRIKQTKSKYAYFWYTFFCSSYKLKKK